MRSQEIKVALLILSIALFAALFTHSVLAQSSESASSKESPKTGAGKSPLYRPPISHAPVKKENTTNVLTLTSIAVTALFGVFGVIGVILFLRQRRYPGQLTFVQNSCVGLVDSIVRNLPELEMLYKKEPIGERIALLKGYIVNTGLKDITSEMMDRPLIMRLPDNYQWLQAKVIACSPDLTPTLQILPDCTSVEFRFRLLKREEYIQFEAIADVPKGRRKGDPSGVERLTVPTRLTKDLEFSHHISDAQPVVWKHVDQEELERFKLRKGRKLNTIRDVLQSFWVRLIGIILVGASILLFEIIPTGRLLYELPTESGETITVKIHLKNNKTIEVEEVNGDYSRIIKEEDMHLLNGLTLKPEYSRRFDGAIPIAVIFLLFSMPIIFDHWKSKKPKKLMGILTKQHSGS